MLSSWDQLPDGMRNDAVRPYYDALQRRRYSLLSKRCFDVLLSLLLMIPLLPIMLVIGILVRLDSEGPALFRQVRITRYGREFQILKFRTMTVDAERAGSQVTVDGDRRITRIGGALRSRRLDELPQLFNIIRGDMSFVGPRPEVPKYVAHYTAEMRATLLLPAGVTSLCSILYKDESKRLRGAAYVDEAYVKVVLPEKMRYNLDAIRDFSLSSELRVIFGTVKSVLLSREVLSGE